MKGRIEGEMKGRVEGRMEAITESIVKALNRGKLTEEEIAEDFGVSVDFVLQIKNERVL